MYTGNCVRVCACETADYYNALIGISNITAKENNGTLIFIPTIYLFMKNSLEKFI